MRAELRDRALVSEVLSSVYEAGVVWGETYPTIIQRPIYSTDITARSARLK